MSGSPARGQVGYYVHHVGRGHLHRATALARHLAATDGPMVTGLSSLSRPSGWPGPWVELPRDDDGDPVAPTAGGRLHWAPLRHDGLRARTARVSAWIDDVRPQAVVVDVSVEMVLLVRLHGVRVVSVVLPGRRDDAAHLLGFEVADALVGFWPPQATGMLRGVPVEVQQRIRTLGALSRHPVATTRPPRRRRAVLLLGGGGHTEVAPPAGTWSWTVAGGRHWVADPSPAVREADVVLTHAGQNALAETAAARRPAVVVPQERPHAEQRTTASVLREGDWPVVVLDHWPSDEDPLERALALDGGRWASWCDGQAAERYAAVVREVAGA